VTKLQMLRDFLCHFTFNFCTEADLQVGIEQALTSSKFHVRREVRLSKADRIDFWIDEEVVIETKIGGSASQVMRQVSRYTLIEEVKGVLLVTNRPAHSLPASFNGKPILVHFLMDGAF
jgi:hypothetical protein